jgi:hypothetical protein
VDVVEKVRKICLALPGCEEKQSHGTPCFFAGKQLVMVWPEGHHGNSRAQLWCAAPEGVQAELIELEGDRFFKPPYLGPRGWVGVYLDGRVDWGEIAAMCEEAFRQVAPKRLVAELDGAAGG